MAWCAVRWNLTAATKRYCAVRARETTAPGGVQGGSHVSVLLKLTLRREIWLSIMKALMLCAAALAASAPPRATAQDVARWEQAAKSVTIIRDDWGIPHVYGRTDADAVFGLMYAQAEDDFNRVETNYIDAMGRLAEAEGESRIYQDLRMKLFINPDSIKAQYAASPRWLKRLMNAWADGLNFYLYKHPEVKPRVITRFEPWMALTFSEGSIGGDIEGVSVPELQAFYENGPAPAAGSGEGDTGPEPTGSNGIAIAPANTINHHALLLINPHTSFFFRAEVQVVSNQGLNAYGAVTWGQFFVYQGFNDRAGWMHTSSGVDAIDEYLESVVKKGNGFYYRYGTEERPLVATTITVPYKTASGMATKEFTVDRTRPVDGSDPTTEWHELLSVDQSPNLLNPPNGWLYNSNNWPWSAAGPYSPKQSDYPRYVETGNAESPRGVHAIRVLQNRKDFTVASLIAAAYDSYLPAFASMIPPLIQAYDAAGAGNPLKAKLADQIALLRGWDYRWSATAVPTSLAVFYGEELGRRSDAATAEQRLQALAAASDKLAADFGSWKTPWGDINRFQRLTGDIVQPFTDAGPSIPVGFTSARWGSLASFGARAYPGTKKWYGTSGNSFVAVVEFGDSVRARAVTAGGESGNPTSPHFNDQAQRYTTGDLREVYFYPSQLRGHVEREYHPGG